MEVKGCSIPKDLYYDECSFEEKVKYAIHDIDLMDKLSVIGYFRQHVLNKHNFDIPLGIINYVLVFLYFVNEDELYIGNFHELRPGGRNTHNWTMFVSTSKTKLIPPRTIQEVTYHLHPTFR